MADASSIRYSATLPSATGRNKGSMRYDTTKNFPFFSDGTEWRTFGNRRFKTNTVSYRAMASGDQVTQTIFVAQKNCKIVRIQEVHSVASGVAADIIGVYRETGTTAAGSGSTVTTFTLDSTANTVQVGTLDSRYVELVRGQRLSVKYTGTLTSLAGVVVTVTFEEEIFDFEDATTYLTVQLPLNGDAVDQSPFVIPAACRLIGVAEVHGTAGTDSGAVTVNIKKNGTSGTALLASALSLKTTAATPQYGTLSATASALTLIPGDYITLDFTGTTTALANVCVTLLLAPLDKMVSFVSINHLAAGDMVDEVASIIPFTTCVQSAMEVHGTATNGACKTALSKDSGTNAPGAGSDMLSNNSSAGFDTNATAATAQDGAFISRGLQTLAPGDRLAVDYSAATTGGAQAAVTAAVIYARS